MLKRWKKSSTEDKVIDTLIALFSIVFIFMTIYPFYYIIVVSFNEGVDASLGGLYWFPRKFTLENYKDFFNDIKWLKGLGINYDHRNNGKRIIYRSGFLCAVI